jgi:hypothetical protein
MDIPQSQRPLPIAMEEALDNVLPVGSKKTQFNELNEGMK